MFSILEKNEKKRQTRDRSNSLRKNIKTYERLSKKLHRNLNDSRENDFDGFEDELE
jgi:hypothetical protein